MSIFSQAMRLTCMAVLPGLIAGCSGHDPVRYSGLDSASVLKPNTGVEADRIPFRYSPQTDWKKFNSIIIDPVLIYQGPDNQFGDMPQSERQKLASYMQEKFSSALRPRFGEATSPSPTTLQLRLTLTGADTTTQFVERLRNLTSQVVRTISFSRSVADKACSVAMSTMPLKSMTPQQISCCMPMWRNSTQTP